MDSGAIAFAEAPGAVASNQPAAADPGAGSHALPRPTGKIMIIDDEKLNMVILARHLKLAGYDTVVSVDDSRQALERMRQERPDLVFLDIMMPHVSGLEILKAAREDMVLGRTPIVMLTASTEPEMKRDALQLGATDFMNKPIDVSELLPRTRNVLLVKKFMDHLDSYSSQLEGQVLRRTAELARTREEVIHCLARAAEFRDDESGRHVRRVGKYARLLAERLGWADERLDMLEQAAQLHDVGKIGIADSILLKPGKLTPEEIQIMQKHCGFGKQLAERLPDNEWNVLRTHTELGGKILSLAESPILKTAMKIALSHHERWDGTGYPLGLSGPDIPIEGRITAIADVFDALSSKRPYKESLPLEQCFLILEEGRGFHFDPECLDAFIACREGILEVRIALAEID